MTSEPQLPDTYYAATAVPHRPRPRLAQDIDTRVCVVGGGFAGLWTARALARRGYDVVVIDAGTVAGGASGRNGGLVSAGYAERPQRIVERVGLDAAKALYALSRHGMDLVAQALLDGMPGTAPTPGRLHVLRHDDEAGARREAGDLAEHFGHEMLVWPTERVRETLKTERYYQALHDAEAFSLHPLNLALGLAADIEKHGGRIFEQTAALGADLDGVRKWVATERGRVRAQDVVFCGSAAIGAGFPQLARAIMPVASHLCVTEPIAGRLQEAIRYAGGISDTRRAGDYHRVVGDRLLWGGHMSTRAATPRGLAKGLARDIARVYPLLKGVAVEHAWTGVMGYPIHRMPQIGMLRPGAWIASGFAGHGLNTTALAGELVSTAIIDHDERWRQFIPFGLVWAGGGWGRRIMRLVLWSERIRDAAREAESHRRERQARRRAALEAGRRLAEEAERKKKAEAQRKRDAEELKKLLAREEEEERRRRAEDERDPFDGAPGAETEAAGRRGSE